MKHRVVTILPKVSQMDGIVINIPSGEPVAATLPSLPAQVSVQTQPPASPIVSQKASYGGHVQLDILLRSLPAVTPLAGLILLSGLFVAYMTIPLSFIGWLQESMHSDPPLP
jgi:hypothetical protein